MNYNRLSQIDYFRKNPIEIQDNCLNDLINFAKNTEFGKKYGFCNIKNYRDFADKIPIFDYSSFKPYIEKVMNGEQNTIWPTEIKWFAKSSGTTAGRSKYIPISKESLDNCHFKSGKDIIMIYADKYPESGVFDGKSLAIGGSTNINENSENSYSGDLSAVLIKNLPFWTYFRRVPNEEISLLEDWDEKLDKIVKTTTNKNVTNLVGVPSWLLVLIHKILDYTGKSNILEVWPNLELFVHGGVNFMPYQKLYEDLIPSSKMTYLETYNASEGFFGIQDEFEQRKDDLLLMLDYGIFYEFIDISDYNAGKMKTIPLAEIKTDVNYAIVISTNGGLWRYLIGDTVKFTSRNPYKFVITGRTKHFINAFGEELIIDNAQKAITYACDKTGARIREFTVAPIFFKKEPQGTHEWLFEFIISPKDMQKFMIYIDNKLKEINSDYDAKRYNNMTMGFPEYHILKKGTFYKWLQIHNKLGGQHKVPRLSNTRDYNNQLLSL